MNDTVEEQVKESFFLELKVLTLTGKIARQLVMQYGISRDEAAKLKTGERKVLGWADSKAIDWDGDQRKCLLVKYDEGDYRWVPWYSELYLEGVKQIIIK